MLNLTDKRVAIFFLIFALTYGMAFAGGVEQTTGHKVGMQDWVFTPAELTIQVGDTVTWLNDDDTNHDVAFYEITPVNAPTREKPQKVRKRKEFTLSFDHAGVFKYVCTIHEDYDMKGVIVVK